MAQPRSFDHVNVPAAVYHRITTFVATVPVLSGRMSTAPT